jgi:integrase
VTSRSLLIRAIAKLVRQHHLDYPSFVDICKEVRQEVGLSRPRPSRHLPKLLSDEALKRFYNQMDEGGDLKHQIMLRLLYYTGVRVGEFVKIKLSDLDLGANRIFIEQGKGDKDRYVLFKDGFRLLLKAYMEAHPTKEYLFESAWGRPYTTRRVRQIVAKYALENGFEGVHPHLFRHQLITWLKRNGMEDAQIQLITGHASRKSLEVYTHLALTDVEGDYQKAMRGVDL